MLGGLDLVESWPEVAPAEPVVGGREVVVAFAFSGACYADVVDTDRMMATRVAVCSLSYQVILTWIYSWF